MFLKSLKSSVYFLKYMSIKFCLMYFSVYNQFDMHFYRLLITYIVKNVCLELMTFALNRLVVCYFYRFSIFNRIIVNMK